MLIVWLLACASEPPAAPSLRQVPLACPNLGATLVLPPTGGGPFPTGVVLVGAQAWDRWGDLPERPWGHYRDVAHAIAGAGGAAVVFDKGGTGETAGQPSGIDGRVAEAVAAVACARERPEVDYARIVLVGHSQGTLVAAKTAPLVKAAGLVLLSPVVGGAEVPDLPVTIVRGEADGGRAMDADLLAAHPHAKHVVVPRGNHLLFEGDPEPGEAHVSRVATGAVAEAVLSLR